MGEIEEVPGREQAWTREERVLDLSSALVKIGK